MKKSLIAILLLLFINNRVQARVAVADSLIRIIGEIHDRSNGEPLAYATISITGRVEQTYSQTNGGFIMTVPARCLRDTLVVTHIGYTPFRGLIAALMPTAHLALEPFIMVLPEVSIGNTKTDLRYIDRNVRLIRDNLYALNCEVTNIEYNYFLNDLKEQQQDDLYRRCDFDLRAYPKAGRDFYEAYHHSPASTRRHRRDSSHFIALSRNRDGYGDFPAVNISHAAAEEYCKWLTGKYNSNTAKKKFKKVKFRLPTLKEWQIAALGYAKFQSWNFLENTVETIVPSDSLRCEMLKGKRKIIPVTDRVLYPWYKAYYYRDQPKNCQRCFLGNFRVDSAIPCPAQSPGYDGFIIQGRVGSYFPNNMGLYDVVGNAAEMIDEDGKALGGSWKDAPEESTMLSIKSYNGPGESIGFRVFMDVVEK